MLIDVPWIEERIMVTKTMILAYEAAILALSNGVVQYSLDTGQSRQSVTKHQLGSLRLQLTDLENRLQTLQNQLAGAGTVYVRPGF
jgi:hypothetical protein